jgi:hypothetical protein
MSAKVSEQSSKKKIIKPLNPSEFVKENVKFSTVRNNTELGLKWVDTTYKRDDSAEKMLVVARGCIIKTFGKMKMKGKEPAPAKDGKPRRDKYSVFMSLKDEEFIEMVKTYEAYLDEVGHENSQAWFDTVFEVEECHQMQKSCISSNDKYGYAIGANLAIDFTCKSKTEEVPDVSDLNVALAKNNIVDVCFHFNKINLGAGTYRTSIEITQINVVGVSEGSGESHGLKPEDYESGKITLTPIQQHEKGGKFCKILYDEHPVRIHLENINGRIFRFEKDDTVAYSMSIRLSDPTFRKMVEGIDDEVFNLLVANSKEYFGMKKTAKLARPMVKQIYSYNKTDQEKIKKGEKPTYDPSIWLKIYFSEEKGFDDKIINAESKDAIRNTEELINKDLNISSLDFYSRHIWFGPKGVSINFTMGKCAITYETTEYDMDAVQDAEGTEEEGEEEAEEEEAANSDNE